MKIFLLFLGLIVFIIFVFFFSKFQIHISNVNIKFKDKKLKVNNDFKVILRFTIFNKITYYKKTIKKNTLKKDQIDRVKKSIIKSRKQNKSKFKNFNKYLKLEKLKLFVEYSTEDAAITAVGTGIASIIISSIIKYIAENSNKMNWKLNPMYLDNNYLNLNLDCIFSIKFVNFYKIIASKEKNKFA